jgi:hypothetical protein
MSGRDAEKIAWESIHTVRTNTVLRVSDLFVDVKIETVKIYSYITENRYTSSSNNCQNINITMGR